jgi:hypothetical protein
VVLMKREDWGGKIERRWALGWDWANADLGHGGDPPACERAKVGNVEDCTRNTRKSA